MSRYRATVSLAPNFAYDLAVRRIRDGDLEGLDLSRWRIAGCGAEPIHAPTLAAFADRFAGVGFAATSFLPCYGLAEHVLAASLPPRGRALRVDRLRAPGASAFAEASADRRSLGGGWSASLAEARGQFVRAEAERTGLTSIVGCGRALPGHEVRVVREDGGEAREREIGEITLAGPSVMLGYYRDETSTAETIRNGWLHTGELGYLCDGELFVCGRAKDIIIVNGRKFHPQDLEWAVDEVAGVRRGRVVAFGISEPGAGDRVVIVVETSGAAFSETLAEIRRRISDAFGLYVDEVVSVPSGTIARTTSGKVQRAAVKAQYERGRS